MKLTSVVPTPNPDALKFTVFDTLLVQGSKSFTSPEAASNDSLASEIFRLEGVTSVFYMSNFVTVNKNSDQDWNELEGKIIEVLKAHEIAPVAEQQPLTGAVAEGDSVASFHDMSPAQKIITIDRLLDDEIRPGLAGDGGGLEVVGLEDNVLQIHYEGACGSCPSATSGTLQYIESMLRSHLDDSLTVVPV